MRIAFLLGCITFSPSNGVLSQAMTWKNGLEILGDEVILVNPWYPCDWSSFDAIIIFGYSNYASSFINFLYTVNSNIVIAPILDPVHSVTMLKLFARCGNTKLHITNSYHSLFSVKKKIKLVLVRSEFEKRYISDVFNIPSYKCVIVPLAHSDSCVDIYHQSVDRERMCLHISLLCDHRKNVRRLIDAAKKYRFPLILAGKLRNKQEEELLNSWIGGDYLIKYLGFVSEEEKKELYSKAKVFALPSIQEGVGIVALDAAASGCDIVLTELGGPKEYYNGMVKLVNPYDVDSIGRAVTYYLNGNTSQPILSDYIKSNFSISKVAQQLRSALLTLK